MKTVDEILADIGNSVAKQQSHWLSIEDAQVLYGIGAHTFANKPTAPLSKASATLSWLCGGFMWAGLLFGCAWFALWAFNGLVTMIGQVF